MQKLKYLIILALVIVLSLLYLQLDDYDTISNSLLDDNIQAQNTIKELQLEIETLEKINAKLQEEIVFLHYKVENLSIEIESLELQSIEKNPLEEPSQEHLETPIKTENEPITLDNENIITGFGDAHE